MNYASVFDNVHNTRVLQVFVDVINHVIIVVLLSPSTVNVTGTTSFTTTISTTASDISPSTSTNLCAVSPSSTACIMAIEDDETGNDTCVCTYVHTLSRVIDNVTMVYVHMYECLLQIVCIRVGFLHQVQMSVCVSVMCTYVYVYVSIPEALTTSDMMWHVMDSI